MSAMHTVELFAGCGGLAKGLELAGFKHAALLEINRQACESLRMNYHPSLVHETDICNVDFRPYRGVELVSGGPPCQPFSLGGLAKAYNDKRDMFPQAARAISEIRPRGFVFENVKGLLREKFRPYFSYILKRLTYPDCIQNIGETWCDHAKRLDAIDKGRPYGGLRYKVCYKLLNAADYGVPQIRERVFIVGLRSDVAEEWSWPDAICQTIDSRIPIADALREVPDPQVNLGYAADHVFIDGARIYPGHTGSTIDKPAKTIKAGAHGVPGGENMLRYSDGSVRYMTVHEAKLIQTFPADYKITGSWGEALRQIGNAVPVRLAEIIGARMFELLKKYTIADVPIREYPLNGSLKGEQMFFALGQTDDWMVNRSNVSGERMSPLLRIAK